VKLFLITVKKKKDCTEKKNWCWIYCETIFIQKLLVNFAKKWQVTH